MKKPGIVTRIAFYSLIFGWLLFIFLCGWGMWLSVPVRISVMFLGFFVCVMGCAMITDISDKFFISVDELDESKRRYI